LQEARQAVTAEFDQYKDDYSAQIKRATSFFGKSHDYFIRAKADQLIKVLSGIEPSGIAIRLLDIGCGHGLMHSLLVTSGLPLDVTGIDVAPGVIDLARRANPAIRYDVYEGDRLPYESGSFDAAVAITVVHHVPPPQWPGFIAEMSRVVRPGGVVVIFEHNPFNPLTAYVVRTCPLDKNAVLLSSRHLSRLMRQSGLQQVTAQFILFSPFESRFFKQFERGLGWLPLGAQYLATGRVSTG
jgi:SAM-dependent methyltransferase